MTTQTLNIKQIILKRGNLTTSSNYVGVMGEVTYDTTLRALRVHNGSLPGGNIVLDTGFISNIQSQIDYIRQNLDPAAIDSLTEAAASITSLNANISLQANLRANADANLQTQITTLMNSKNLLLTPNFVAALSATTGNLYIPGGIFFDRNTGNINGSNIEWRTPAELMQIGPNVTANVLALHFSFGNSSFYYSNVGVLTVPDELRVANIKINATGMVFTNNNGTQHWIKNNGDITVANNAVISTADSTGNTAGMTIGTGVTSTGNTGTLTLRSGAASLGAAGAVEIIAGSTVSGTGGNVVITAGSTTTGDGGDVKITTGSSVNDTPGNGGDMTIVLGSGQTGDGGEFKLTAGSTNIGNAGSIALVAGSTNSGTAGSFSVQAGSSNIGAAGGISLIAGSSSGVTQAGNVIIEAGTNSTSATYHGHIILRSPGGSWNLAPDSSTSIPGSLSTIGALTVGTSASIGTNLLVGGNLTVLGTTTTISTVNVTVTDKNLELGKVASPDNITADGAGITVLGSTNKTFNWVNATASWTSSENIDLAVARTYRIGTQDVLSASGLGANVINSSLTTLGTINTGTWQATVISPTYGGTGVNNGTKTITLGGTLATLGAFNLDLTLAANTALTLPSTGTVATLAGTETFTNKTLVNPNLTVNSNIAGVVVTGTTGTGHLVFDNSPVLITPALGVATATSINKITLSTPATGATLTIADGKIVTVNNTLTFSGTDAVSVNFAGGGTVAYTGNTLAQFASTTSSELFNLIADKTGTGSMVFATTPTLVTPVLGVATATSINRVTITAPAAGSTLTLADGKTLTVSNTVTLVGTDGSSVNFGGGGAVAYTGTGLNQFASTTSSQLAGVISDETGTGSLVFATSPTLVTPTLGVATATSLNKITISTPATGATLTLADGKTLVVNNSLTFTGTDAASVNFGTGGTVVYTGSKLSAMALTTSAEFGTVIADETGSGLVVFNNTPTLVTPILGVATATSINKLNITPPTNSATLTITDGKTLAVVNTLSFSGTDSAAVNFTGGGTVAYIANKLNVFSPTSSAEFSGAITDETGSGNLVFAIGPTLTNAILVNPTIPAVADLVVNGNLTVNGTTATINSTVVSIDDVILTLGGDTVALYDDNKDRGIEFRWHNGTVGKSGFFGFDDSTGKFTFIPDATNTNEIYSGTPGTIDVGAIHINGVAFAANNISNGTTGTGSVVLATSPTIDGTLTVTGNIRAESLVGNLIVEGTTSANVITANVATITTILPTWEQVDITAGSATGALYLSASSARYIYITNNNNSRNIRLPDATTIARGTRFTLRNSGNSGFPVQTSNGTAFNLSIYQNQTLQATSVTNGSDGTSSWALEIIGSSFTGSGSMVMSFAPTLTTPTLGVATATSINKVSFTQPANGSTLTIADGKTLTVNNTVTLAAASDGVSINFGGGGTVANTSVKLSVFATTTSAELASVISDETGSGKLVFATSPDLVTPNIGVATGTSLTTSGDITVNGILKIEQASETFSALTSATGVVTHDCSTGQVFTHSSISANFTVNLTNLNLDSGRVSAVTLVLNQGATPYMATALQIGGAAQTINWQTGSAPAGIASKRDVVTFTIFNSSGTYTVLGQSVTFG